MTTEATLRSVAPPPRLHAPLTNMKLALRTLLDCEEAGEGSPRFGLFYGYSGYGKTVAAAFCAAQRNGIYVEAKSVWTKRTLLQAIAREMGIARLARTAPDMLQQVIDQLNYEPRPLILDEFDHVVRKGDTLEIIRDIHDSTSVAIVMIGEEELPAKLKEWQRFDNRVLAATAAQPATAEDARALRDHYCGRIAIADDLLAHIAESCKGITRRIVVNLKEVQRAAASEGVDQIDRAWWGKRPLRTGDLTTRRAA